MTQRDLDFVAGNFVDYDVPKDRRFLLKYFKSDLQIAFVKYYLFFGEYLLFRQHTGHFCSRRILYRFLDRVHALVDAYERAKADLSEVGMETVLALEKGEYRVRLGKQHDDRRAVSKADGASGGVDGPSGDGCRGECEGEFAEEST